MPRKKFVKVIIPKNMKDSSTLSINMVNIAEQHVFKNQTKLQNSGSMEVAAKVEIEPMCLNDRCISAVRDSVLK